MHVSPSTRRERRRPRPLLVERLEGRLNPGFLASLAFDAGTNPSSVAVADVNGDGLLDLAIANSGSTTVSVLLGNGDGSFQAQRLFSVGSSPNTVVVGDVNGDGRLDLAAANYNSATVSVLVGNGNGSFQAARHFSAGGMPVSVAVGDVNGDSRLDLTVANYFSNTVSVLLGNGNGSFQAPRAFPAGRGPLSVAVGDVNGDGRLDLATAGHYCEPEPPYACFDQTARVLLGNGNGTFQAPRHFPAGSGARFVAVGDVNGDSRLDLAVTNRNNGDVSVLLGNGDGSFQAARHEPVGGQPRSVALADVNSDGLPDLAITSSGTVRVLLGNGDSTFQTAVSYVAGGNPRAVAVADFDGDGWLDLATANAASHDVSVLLNDGYWGGPAVAFALSPDSGTVTAGSPFDLSVSALNDVFEVVTNYTGAIVFFTTDPLATVPDMYRFQLTDRGIASFPAGMTFQTPGVQELYVFDTATFEVIGYAVFDVVGAGPGGSPGPGGDGGPAAPDLFIGQELTGTPPRRVHREAVPFAESRQDASIASDRPRPLRTAGTSPAARLDRSGAERQAVLDLLFARREALWQAR